MSGEPTPETKPERRWIIQTPLGFFRCYDLSVRSVTFTQDAQFAQSWGLREHADGYIKSTCLSGIPTEIMPRLGAQEQVPMDAQSKGLRSAIESLTTRIGG